VRQQFWSGIGLGPPCRSSRTSPNGPLPSPY